MTVRRGDQWGEPAARPAGAVEAFSDDELAAAIAGGGTRPVVVRGGDLHRAVGGPSGDQVLRRLPIDVMRVTADGIGAVAVAHVVVRRRGRAGWWRGPVVGVLNVDHIGDWDVAPRAHPNDGWLDVVEVSASMSLRARWQAWRRLPAGTHVPHPEISVRRSSAEHLEFGEPIGLWIDGMDRGTVHSLSVRVAPDAATIYV